MIFRLLATRTMILCLFCLCLFCIKAKADEISGTSAAVIQAIPDSDATGVTNTVTITGIGLTPGQTIVAADFSINLGHTWIGDLIVKVSHLGVDALLFSRVGGTPGDNSDLGQLVAGTLEVGEYQFKDGGGDLWAEAEDFGHGTNYIVRSVGAAGDPNPYRASNGANVMISLDTTFQGLDPTGDWTFTVSDMRKNDVGSLGQASVHLVTVPEPGTVAGIAMLSMFGGVYFRRKHLAKKLAMSSQV